MWATIVGAFLLIPAAIVGPARLAFGQDGTWDPLPPPQVEPRLFAGDSLRDRLLFQTATGPIWSLSTGGSSWSLLDPAAPPGEPFYDPIEDRLIVIGRTALSTLVATRPMGGSAWDSLRISGIPALQGAPRSPAGALMRLDARRNRILLFGPAHGDSVLSEVWELPLSAPQWTQLMPLGVPPSPRRGSAAILDPVRDRLILFSGNDRFGVCCSTTTYPRDTWELQLGNTLRWREIQTLGVLPPGKSGVGAVYDPQMDQVIMIGGRSISGSVTDRSYWVLPLAGPPEWRTLSLQTSLPLQPSPRVVFDVRRNRTIIAGVSGENGASQAATQGWSLTYYPQFNPPAYLEADLRWPPQPPMWTRAYAAGVHDPAGERMIVFGGRHGGLSVEDTWSLSLPSQAWTKLVPWPTQVPPIGLQEYSPVVLDATRNRLLRFQTLSASQIRAYSLDLQDPSGWVPVDAGGVIPFGRDHPSLVLDTAGDRVLMFGGLKSGGLTNELWELSLAGRPTWQMIVPDAVAPAERARAAAVYDSIGNRLVVFGGSTSSGAVTDTWVCGFDGTPTWSPLNPGGTPPGHVFSDETDVGVAYDPLRSRMIALAPDGEGMLERAWALDLGPSPSWSQLDVSGPAASARFGATVVFDTKRNAAVMFAGSSPGLPDFDMSDTWVLTFPPVPLPELECPGTLRSAAGSLADFEITVTSPADRVADYRLTSERDWPGFPMTGTLDLPAGLTVAVPLGVLLPDTIAGGPNVLMFTITPRGGAATAGCAFSIEDTTRVPPTLMSAVAAAFEVRLAWYAPDADSVRIERRLDGEDWSRVAGVEPDGDGHATFADLSVRPGRRYAYRATSFYRGEPYMSGETWIDVPPAIQLALGGLQPNPSGARVRVALVLPDMSSARLELIDISGRRVVDRVLDGLGPGPHVIDLDAGTEIRSGVYFVRLSQGASVLTARGVILR